MDLPDTRRTEERWDWLVGLTAIWGARYQIAAATVAAGVLTAGVVLLIPRTYVAAVTVRVGRVMDRTLADPLHVSVAINSESMAERVIRAGYTGRTLEDLIGAVSASVGTQLIGTNVTGSPFVSVLAEGRSPDEAKRLAQAVVGVILEEHHRRFDASIQRLNIFGGQIQRQVTAVQAEVVDIEAALKAFRANPTVSAPAVLLMRAQLEEKQAQILTFLREQRDFDLNLVVNTERTAVLADPIVMRALTRPRRTVTTLAGASSAFVLAVFWALVRDERRGRSRSAGSGGAR